LKRSGKRRCLLNATTTTTKKEESPAYYRQSVREVRSERNDEDDEDDEGENVFLRKFDESDEKSRLPTDLQPLEHRLYQLLLLLNKVPVHARSDRRHRRPSSVLDLRTIGEDLLKSREGE
jgi:hypothetical protein